MSYTNDYKEQNIDTLYEWVMENKHREMECYFEGGFNKDDYEKQVDTYIEDNADALWEEFFTKFGR